MAGGAEKLSIARIRAAKPHKVTSTASGKGPRWAKYGDGKGLWLMVGPTGSKRWHFIYTMNKKTQHLSLGEVDVDDLEANVRAARAKSRELRDLLRLGIDPKAKLALEREAERDAILASLGQTASPLGIPTFKAAAERYMDLHDPETAGDSKVGKWSKKTAMSWRNTMRDHVFPAIGDKRIDAVDLEAVLTVLRPIWHKIPVVAGKVRGRLGTILAYAASKGWREDNDLTRPRGPIDHELKPHPKGRAKNHDSMDYADLPEFMVQLRANRAGFAPRALELLILTAARTADVLAAEWGEIDLTNKVWSIPGPRMKMRRDHVIPLSEDAVTLLEALPREIGNPYVFPSPNKAKSPLSNMAMTNVLKRMKRKDGVTVHGFRSTFSTWVGDKCLDIPSHVKEAALAHIKGGVEGVYDRGTRFEARRGLMTRWATYAASAA